MRKAILMLLLVFVSSSAMAMSCYEDIIRTISPDGAVLIMLSGAMYDVDEADYIYSREWAASNNVSICSVVGNVSEISNKDAGAQKISAKRIN